MHETDDVELRLQAALEDIASRVPSSDPLAAYTVADSGPRGTVPVSRLLAAAAILVVVVAAGLASRSSGPSTVDQAQETEGPTSTMPSTTDVPANVGDLPLIEDVYVATVEGEQLGASEVHDTETALSFLGAYMPSLGGPQAGDLFYGRMDSAGVGGAAQGGVVTGEGDWLIIAFRGTEPLLITGGPTRATEDTFVAMVRLEDGQRIERYMWWPEAQALALGAEPIGTQ